jgi:hypothetical protein
MSEYLQEAFWRENYRDLVAGVGMIREAVEEAFGPVAPLPNRERTSSRIEDCEHIARAIMGYPAKLKDRITEPKKQSGKPAKRAMLANHLNVADTAAD